jgi:DNA mismatch repair protein MutS
MSKHVIEFVRVGDFYEVYGDSAFCVVKELELVQLSKLINNVRVPMTGVPYHAIERYKNLLKSKGYEVTLKE